MRNWLRSLLADEQHAVKSYSEAAKDARSQGEDSTAKLFDHIRAEEQEHRRELQRRIAKSRGFVRNE